MTDHDLLAHISGCARTLILDSVIIMERHPDNYDTQVIATFKAFVMFLTPPEHQGTQDETEALDNGDTLPLA